MALSEKSLNSPVTKIGSAKKPKAIIGTENTPISFNGCNNVEVLYEDDEIVKPARRNSVKRNLNKSFGNSPPKEKSSILSYTIVSSDSEEEGKLVLRLKASKKRYGQNTEKHLASPPKMRKSGRSMSRKSYTDYTSPRKTPTKRRLYRRSDESEDSDFEKVPKSSPKKQSRSDKSCPRRNINTPKRYVEDSSPILDRKSTPKQDDSSRKTRSCRKSISYNENDIMNRMNESLRRNILRTKLKTSPEKTKSRDNDKKKTVNLDDCLDEKILKIQIENLNLSTDSFKEDSDDSFLSCDSRNSPPRKVKSINGTPKSTKKAATTSTPSKTPQSARKNIKETPKSSKNRAKLIREGIVTPSMHERSKPIKGNSTPLVQARSQLHVSHVPDSLPCREKEYCDVYNFIEDKLLDECGGCMYISGVPGTGKTATVTSVIGHLQADNNIPKFAFVSINGMRLSEPRQSYVEILKQLTGKTLSWEQAQNNLEDMFVNKKKWKPIVMLIDELDILCTKRQDVVYNLLDWPTKAKNQLVVITIANTMDLPERLLMNRVTSRLGLTRLTFQAYTYKQLQEIVTKRISGTDSFNPEAVQFVARKVASVSGDARRALDICRRAAEIAELEGKAQLVNISHVNEALSAMITQPKVLAIKSCSRLEQLLLQSVVAEVERTGVEETVFSKVYKMLITCAGIEGFPMVSVTLAHGAVSRLSSCRLILADQKCNNIYQKIILNVSIDDVYYALKKN